MVSPTASLPNRAFGGMVIAIFTVVGILNGWRGGIANAWPLVIALLVLVPTLWRPALLSPATRAWLAFSGLLHRVVSPITLGVLYFGLITPLAAALRLGRRDTLMRSFETGATSYWIERIPPGPDVAGLSRQF